MNEKINKNLIKKINNKFKEIVELISHFNLSENLKKKN